MSNNLPLKIYVLDDDPTYRKMLVCYLEVLGHQVRGFQTADECLANLDGNPDLILLDHNLEGEQKGVDILRFIKLERPDISVIYVTGEENPTLVSDVFRSGSEDFIGKDSASLIRLKLKLDDILARRQQAADRKKKNRRLVFAGIILLTIYLVVQLAVLN